MSSRRFARAPKLPRTGRDFYVVRYGSTRGPVAHRIRNLDASRTRCGLLLAEARQLGIAGAGTTWGRPQLELGPGILLCGACRNGG